MSSSNRVFDHRRNAPTMLKRRSDDNRCFQEDRIRYTPPLKRPRSQTQTQTQTQTRFLPASHGVFPLYNHGSNVSRVSNYYGDDVVIPYNCFPFANDSSSSIDFNFQKYGNPNPQFVNDDLSFDSLPEWVPNRSNFPIRSSNLVTDTNHVRFSPQEPNMISTVSQAMTQPPIVSKDMSDLLNVLNSQKEKEKSSESPPLGLDFDLSKLNIRHESVIKSLYSDMPRQCSSCGVRFKCQEDHSNHMDWHVRKNRNGAKTISTKRVSKKSREWFASSSLWLTGAAKACFNANGETQKKKEEEEHVVPADECQKMCALCIEPFEEFFSHEEDEWMYKDAVYLNMKELGPIVHAKCMPEPQKEPAREKPMVMSASSLVC